jgi:hypothetical protein
VPTYRSYSGTRPLESPDFELNAVGGEGFLRLHVFPWWYRSIILDIQVVLAFASDAQIEEEGIQIVQGQAIHDFLMLGARPMRGNLLIKSTDNRSLTCP